MSMFSEALDYARRGWYVFPCREKPGKPYIKNNETITPTEKQPYIAKGLLDATIDEEQIEAWWYQWPNAMIGVNAGMSGLFVIDLDKKHVNGLDTFAGWNINDSAGLHSFTPSGGSHIIFTGIGKTSSNSRTGIDTRGEGGYFIAPPSKIIEGEFTGEYRRFDDWGKTPGVIPDGLMSKLFPDKSVEYVKGSSSPSVDGEKKQLSRATLTFLADGAPSGERNSTLFKVLADFAGCGYSREHAKETVSSVCNRIGLTVSELEQVLNHAYSKRRTSSIPDSIQEKILEGGKNIASRITFEEQIVMEDALLACLIVDNGLIPPVSDILNTDDFQVLKNRVIYKAINRLYNTGMKVDYITASNEVLKETDKISMDDISKMINQYFVNTDNVLTYAIIIKEKASIRKLEALMDNKIHYMNTGNFVEIIATLEKDVADIALYGGTKSTNVLDSKQATDMVAEQTRKIIAGEIQQLKTGFSNYDYHIGGLYSNELVVCAGRPGDGKSALAMSIANHVALVDNKAVAMFSLEMSTHESICRLICQLTGIPFKDIYQGKLNKTQWENYKEAMTKISDSKLYFDDTFGITVPELRSKIRKLMEKDIKLIVIDQLEQIKGYDGQPEYIRFDRISYDIKNFTKEFDTPIILIHQMNRGITDRKIKNAEPQLSDLNQAGEKPANQVWVISHRKDEEGTIEQSKIKILKNRNGPTIEFPVTYVGSRMLFSNPAWEEQGVAFKNTNEYREETDDDVYASEGTHDEPYWARKG